MARKVFVSYKYADPNVYGSGTTCRDYVDALQEQIEETQIYKGEEDGDNLSAFKNSTIETKLKEKIRDSSVTIVLMSKGMVEPISDKAQWIPWEIKYSLLKTTADGRTSLPNGLLAVIVPDEAGSFEYYFQSTGCGFCNSVTHNRDWLFEIMRNNMFNRSQPKTSECLNPTHGSRIHTGSDHSYMHQVRWDRFINSPDYYIELAIGLRDRASEFDIQKRIKKA